MFLKTSKQKRPKTLNKKTFPIVSSHQQMFCASNERFQNITEKTKLLAQKCTQQISSHHKPTSQKSKTTDDIEKKNSTNSFKYLCACTGGTLRSFRRKNKDNGVGTVRWYVKVTCFLVKYIILT